VKDACYDNQSKGELEWAALDQQEIRGKSACYTKHAMQPRVLIADSISVPWSSFQQTAWYANQKDCFFKLTWIREDTVPITPQV
jgi:hypothetical protein